MRLLNDIESLNALHWSERAQQYSDYGLHSNNVSLVEKLLPDGRLALVREVHTEPEIQFVDNVNGYANLFPFLLRILPPESPKLAVILAGVNNTEVCILPFFIHRNLLLLKRVE